LSEAFGGALQALSAAVATAAGVPEPRQPAEPIDWREFLRLVDRHHVAPQVERSGWLRSAGAPNDVAGAVHDRARKRSLWLLRMLAFHREILGLLGDAGVDVVVLKGVTLAVDGYEDPGARTPGDLDLLVDPGSVPRAVAALKDAGFDWHEWGDPNRVPLETTPIERLPRLPVARDVALARGGIKVELHWRLFPNSRLMPVDPGWLRAPRYVEAGGVEIPSLPLDAQWLYVLVHGSVHFWSRMKWLADVPVLGLRHPELASRAFLTGLDAAYRRAVATGLILAEAAFGEFLTPDARAWAARVGGIRMHLRKCLKTFAAEHDRPTEVSARALPGLLTSRLALRRDAAYRLEELRSLLIYAARAQAVEDPSAADLARGPFRWTVRAVRRFAGRDA
jgi:Uncharacterised nucleotidyltransferase